MNLRRERRSRRSGIGLDIINLIDIMLVLLVFFMATTTFVTVNDSVQLALPQSEIVNPIPPQPIVVSVNAQEELFINEKPVSENDFVTALSQVLQTHSDNETVLIKGDKSLSYGYLVKVMTWAKNAGATQLDIATTPVEQ